MTHIVQFSTGLGSTEVARRVVNQYGVEHTLLLSADTLKEDEDNWRFATEAWEFMRWPRWVRLADGRTPMEVGRDARCVPNNRMAVCSRVLKRELLRTWLDENCDPATDTIYMGFDWTEEHRHTRAVPHWLPWTIVSPLLEAPFMQKPALINFWRDEIGIEPPRLYAQGFGHANCGGGCVRSGQASWALLLKVNPERYAEWEAEEQESRRMLGKNVAILRDRKHKTTKPLPLKKFRLRLEGNEKDYDEDDWGACGCTDEPIAEIAEVAA